MGRYDIPDPLCNHVAHAFRVSSHEDIVEASRGDDLVASVWVCPREKCREDAKEWVYAQTHREALVFPAVRT
jgi:hypothetical protein